MIDALGRVRSLAALLGATDATGTAFAAGAGGIVLTFFGYLLKELRRKDDSVWRILAEKDKEISRLERVTAEKDRTIERLGQELKFWREGRLAEEDEAWEAEADRQAEVARKQRRHRRDNGE